MRRGHFLRALAGAAAGCTLRSQPRDLEFTPSGGARSALLIGNNQYRHLTSLRNAVNDATDMDATLQALGFRCVRKLDADRATMSAAIQSFTGGLKPGDDALLFYAGHGFQIDGENFLVPVDFAAKTEEGAVRAAVPIEPVKEDMEESGARLTIVVMDACRNNPMRRTRAMDSQGLAPMEGAIGSLIAFATGPGQTASDNPEGRNGLYTSHLLAALKEPIDVVGIFRKARSRVFEASGGGQRPWLHEDVLGEIYFAKAKTVPSGSVPPTSLAKGHELFRKGDFKAALDAFELARRVHPDDPYAQNAAGAAYDRLKLHARAVECYSKAIELKPDYAAAYYNRGLSFLRDARYALAIQDFEWAMEEQSGNPVLYELRGTARFGLRDYENALADFAEAIALNPSHAAAFHGRGMVYNRQSRWKDALAEFERAIDLNPRMWKAYQDRAIARRRLGDTTGAAADEQAAERLRPR